MLEIEEELRAKIKELEHKLFLNEQALGRSSDIYKKYDDALVRLTQKENFTSVVIESNKNAIIAINEKRIVTVFNKSAESMFGYTKQEMLHKDSLLNIVPEHFSARHFSAIENFMKTKKSIGILDTFVELDGKHKDGTIFPIRIGFGVELNHNSIIVIANIEDITSEKKAHSEVQDELKEQKNILNYQAHHDSLTGLPNRILFNDRLGQAIEKAKRNSLKIALLFIDLDHFKEINDSLGHIIGDEILKSVTLRLKKSIRDEDTLARLGGDEFTVILENITQVEDASLAAKNILDILIEPIDVDDNILYVSSSIGISIYPDDGGSAANLLKFADSAMYKAKDEGRNNYQYYNSQMTELALERVAMEASLRAAIQNEEFVVYYQPQVNGITNKLVGMEALVRWQHPTIGLISPDKFIPLAESTGLIIKIDNIVMRTAMTQLSRWYKAGLNPGILAMNLAVKQLEQENFSQMFEVCLQRTQCKREWLELEVTEGQIMTNPEKAILVLQEISNMEVELAVDDFGTGYSSLAYLKKLPINKLKIDQAFIRNLPDDDEDAAIARAVIALANSLNLKVIAEGVETIEQRDFMVQNGCENIQGYFYSKPVPANELEDILIKGIL